MKPSKEELRAKARRIRLDMTGEEAAAKSRLIINELIGRIDWLRVRYLHIYKAIASLNEVDTEGLIKYIKSQQPQVNLIIQDKTGAHSTRQLFDLIIIPALAFDKNCNRLGWGGGFYDKFLASQPAAQKIGLCYENGLVNAGISIEPHDIPLDMVITEGIIVSHDSNTGKDRPHPA